MIVGRDAKLRQVQAAIVSYKLKVEPFGSTAVRIYGCGVDLLARDLDTLSAGELKPVWETPRQVKARR
ncbi:MAG TPA: hypothetical protein PLN31_19615 [Azoarcus taiwanensis]|nr:hypothetical protein [Azoarcus taiwanensis]